MVVQKLLSRDVIREVVRLTEPGINRETGCTKFERTSGGYMIITLTYLEIRS
jgi:hypothetical protein